MSARRVPRHGRIPCDLHRDAAFRRLTAPAPNAQTLLLYLFSADEATSIPGLVRAGVAALAESLGWSTRVVERHLEELTDAGFLQRDQDHRLIWMPRQLETTPPTSPKQVVAWARLLLEYRESRLFNVVKEAIESTVDLAGSGLRKAWDAEIGANGAFAKSFGKAFGKRLGKGLTDTDTTTDTDDALPRVVETQAPGPSSTSSVTPLASSDLHGWRLAAMEMLELWGSAGPPGTRPIFEQLTAESTRKLRDALAAKSLGQWEAIFARAARSDYLAGRGEYPPISIWKALAWADRIDAGEFDNRAKSAPAPSSTGERPLPPLWTAEDDAEILERQRAAAEIVAARKARGDLPYSEQIRLKREAREAAESARAADEIRQRADGLATDRPSERPARSA